MITLLAAASLAATTISPQARAILDAANAAAGGNAVRALGPYELDSDVTWGSLKGTAVQVCDPKSGTWARSESVGRFVDGDGFDGTQVWTKDSTGDSWVVVDRSQVTSAFEASYLCSFGYWFPERMPAVQISTASSPEADDRTADTIQIALPDLDWLYLSFDKQTHLLKRVLWNSFTNIIPTETDYDDYRQIAGVKIAFARASKSVRHDSQTYYAKVKSATLDPGVAAQVALHPAHLSDVTIAPSPKPVPIDITGGRIYVEANIDGKGPFKF